MPQPIKSSSIVIAIILLWAAPSALIGRAFNTVQPCTFLSIIFCLLLLLPIIRNDSTWKKLTFQEYPEQEGEPINLLLGALIAMPFVLLIGALVTWLVTVPLLF